MKRIVACEVCILALSVLLLAGCQPAANTNAPVVTATPEQVDTNAIQTELLRIENDWPRIIKEKDSAAIERFEAEDAVFIYPDGSLGNKAQDLKDVSSGALTADAWQVSDLQVTILDADSAFVVGRTTVTNGKYSPPGAKPSDISGQYRFIDTYARRNGEWKLVAGASTPVREAAPGASPAMSPSPVLGGSPVMKASPATKPSPAVTHSPLPPTKASPTTTP